MRTKMANFYNEIRRAIKNGCRLLDDKNPGWDGKICLDKLDMLNQYECIIGQLYGCYSNQDLFPTLYDSEETEDAGYKYGFSLLNSKAYYQAWQSDYDTQTYWDILTDEWKKVIISRQVQPK